MALEVLLQIDIETKMPPIQQMKPSTQVAKSVIEACTIALS